MKTTLKILALVFCFGVIVKPAKSQDMPADGVYIARVILPNTVHIRYNKRKQDAKDVCLNRFSFSFVVKDLITGKKIKLYNSTAIMELPKYKQYLTLNKVFGETSDALYDILRGYEYTKTTDDGYMIIVNQWIINKKFKLKKHHQNKVFEIWYRKSPCNGKTQNVFYHIKPDTVNTVKPVSNNFNVFIHQ